MMCDILYFGVCLLLLNICISGIFYNKNEYDIGKCADDNAPLRSSSNLCAVIS